MKGKLTKEAVIAEARTFVKRVDYGALEAKGLLRKAGAWYEVPNIHKLPKHLRTKITELKDERGKTFAKFASEASIERFAKKMKKYGL